MRLYERYGDRGFHTCIATTFGLDFDAYENIVQPRLRSAGCFNNVILVDQRMLTYALDGASVLPEHAGRHYTVAGVDASSVFHPKITLQLGRALGRAIITSANMTASGLAGNLELAGEINCTSEGGGEAQLIAAVWQYLSGAVDNGNQALEYQLQWLRTRTPWLFETEPASGPVTLTDGSEAALLTTGTSSSAAGIGSRFAALIEDEPVERLIVVSPYWDPNLAALRALAEDLDARKVIILIDTAKALFPSEAVTDLRRAQIFDLHQFGGDRFIHAKAIIAETAQADHLLYGSANCTSAALGGRSSGGVNHEACLYRRLPAQTIVVHLGLDKVIEGSAPVRLDDLPPYEAEAPVPLSEAGPRAPGEFECAFGMLYWRPPIAPVNCAAIELLDSAGEPMPAELKSSGSGNAVQRCYEIVGALTRPAFARLRYEDGTASAPAIVTLIDRLREAVREARGGKTESIARRLSEETEEGLWLWEVLNELEAAELAQDQEASPGTPQMRQRREHPAGADQYRTLNYEQFIAGRRLRADKGGATRDSLAGTELSLVRAFLNRILAIGDNPEDARTAHDEAIAGSLDLGDETNDAARALEEGETFTEPPGARPDTDGDKEEERLHAARAKASRAHIAKAVRGFIDRLGEKAESEQINTFDVLRLRAMLIILAAAGRPNASPSKPSTLQVLPPDDSKDGWPRLMGQVLFAFFGGRRPAIARLEIEDIYDRLPDDFLECWATAGWAVHACICAARSRKEMRGSTLRSLTRLAESIYAITKLRPSELTSEGVSNMFDKLNQRYAGRLGIDPDCVETAQEETIRKVNSLLCPD